MNLPNFDIKSYSGLRRRQFVGFLVTFFSLIVFSLTVSALYRSVSPFIKAAPESVPQKVTISNVNAQGFSVSWISDAKTTGYLTYVTGVGGPVKTKADDRASDSLTYISDYNTHHVSIHLDSRPATGKLGFRINSGTKMYGGTIAAPTDGADYILVDLPTAPSVLGAYSREPSANSSCPNGLGGTNSACFRPYPIWGTVSGDDGKGALVYARVLSNSKEARSNLLSVVSDHNGNWILDLANALNAGELSSYVFYSTDVLDNSPDRVEVTYRNLTKETTNSDFLLHSVIDTNPLTMDKPSPITFSLTGGGGTEPPPPPTDHKKLRIAFSLQGMEKAIPISSLSAQRQVQIILKGARKTYTATDTCDFSLISPTKNVCNVVMDLTAAEVDFTDTYKLLVKPNGYITARISSAFTAGIQADTEPPIGGSIIISKAGDFDNDNKIKLADITKFLSVFTSISLPASAENSIYDLNGDGTINVVDLSIVLSNYTALEVAGDE